MRRGFYRGRGGGKGLRETGGIFNENGIVLSLKLKGHRTPPVEIVDKPLCLHAKMRGRKADRQLHAHEAKKDRSIRLCECSGLQSEFV